MNGINGLYRDRLFKLVIFLPTFSYPGDKVSVFFTGYVMISCTVSLLIFYAVRYSLAGMIHRDESIPIIGISSLTDCKVWLFFNSSSICKDLI